MESINQSIRTRFNSPPIIIVNYNYYCCCELVLLLAFSPVIAECVRFEFSGGNYTTLNVIHTFDIQLKILVRNWVRLYYYELNK